MNPMQLILIAGAGYLVYLWYEKQQSSAPPSGLPPAATPPASTGGTVTPPLTTPPSGQLPQGPIPPGTTPPGAVTQPALSPEAALASLYWNGDAQVLANSGMDAATAREFVIMNGAADSRPGFAPFLQAIDYRLNVDQWNYYRALMKSPVAAELMPQLLEGLPDRGTLITAGEYLNRLHGVGLSGLGYSSSSPDMAFHWWA